MLVFGLAHLSVPGLDKTCKSSKCGRDESNIYHAVEKDILVITFPSKCDQFTALIVILEGFRLNRY